MEPEPERVETPEEKYNRAVDFSGARLEVLPLYGRVVPGFVNNVPLLFQFVTGTNPSLKRESFSVAVVLDVSGSMQGGKLDNCKTAIKQLIDSTGDDDLLSLVTYSDRVKTIFDSVCCGDGNARQSMRQKVEEVCTEGQTDLYGGLLEGYELLRRQGEETNNKYIFLLSDGDTNCGAIQRTDAILKAVEMWEEKVPILSYGIGSGFNEKLMSPLGQVHRGSHYFYITGADSIERLIGRGVKALTGAVARNVRLRLSPQTSGVWLPDNLIGGTSFPLVRGKSVIQFLVELEVRPELPQVSGGSESAAAPEDASAGWPFACRRRSRGGGAVGTGTRLGGDVLNIGWEVEGFELLTERQGAVSLRLAEDRGTENEEVRTFLDVRKGCELRRSATSGPEARKTCEQALKLFERRLDADRFGFAEEWAAKTKALLDDRSAWRGQEACGGAAKSLGVAHRSNVVQEEEEEEEMDFDLFG